MGWSSEVQEEGVELTTEYSLVARQAQVIQGKLGSFKLEIIDEIKCLIISSLKL